LKGTVVAVMVSEVEETSRNELFGDLAGFSC
jgi:hypothetical protein